MNLNANPEADLPPLEDDAPPVYFLGPDDEDENEEDPDEEED